MESGDGQLLADARRRAGLSQRRLAALAGTSQAMVARIEGGRQAPSLATLRRLVRACGANLHVKVDGDIPRRLGEPAAPDQAADASTDAPPTVGGRHLMLRVGDAPVAVPVERVREVLPVPELRPDWCRCSTRGG
jgi:transcriptional regulator with XRE-family HTH domain